MSTFDFLAQLAPILSFLAILTAIIFGLIQLRQFKTQRKDLAAVEIMRTMQDAQFTDSLNRITRAETIASNQYIAHNDPQLEKAILALTTKFETLGFLVYKKVIPLEFVEQLIGGVCIALWEKLQTYIFEYREINDQRLFLEWFEWLAHQFKKRKRDQAIPAISKVKNWNS